MASDSDTKRFLRNKVRALAARSARLAQLNPQSVGIRSQDVRFAPLTEHYDAANKRLAAIDRTVKRRLEFLLRHLDRASPRLLLLYAAMVEREVDRARRAFGMFFEVFSQRGSAFAPALAAHDAIAADCYAAVSETSPQIFSGKLLKPLTYLEHGYSPATMRRGVTLGRLLGETNPFPMIRIPWDRDNPWQSVFLHEVAHNLQADLRVWQENKDAVTRRMIRSLGDPMLAATFSRWHKEIFADLAAVLLGGTAVVWGMMDFLAHPPPKVLTYRPGGVHPTGYLRVPILAEMLRRMGFADDAVRVQKVWASLYRPERGHRLPPRLLETAGRSIPVVVDEIAFQPRRNLAQRALADVIRFDRGHERQIRSGAAALARNVVPKDLPPRFMVSASRQAIGLGASLPHLAELVTKHLAETAAARRSEAGIPTMMAA